MRVCGFEGYGGMWGCGYEGMGENECGGGGWDLDYWLSRGVA